MFVFFEKDRSRSQSRTRLDESFGIQRWPFYHDLAIRSGHCTISSELVSLRHSRLERSLYNLVYTPNDELNYFILYTESCSFSSYLKFILDVQAYENLSRRHLDVQQNSALNLFQRYLAIDATYFIPISEDIRRTTLCRSEILRKTSIFRLISSFFLSSLDLSTER